MGDRERRYHVVVVGPAPADLDERCAAIWCELLDIVDRLIPQRGDSEHSHEPDQDGDRGGADQDRQRVLAE